MKFLFTLSLLLAEGIFMTSSAQSNNAWPKTANTSSGSSIKMYEWETESYTGNTLKARAAFSVIPAGQSDPVFGVLWLTASLSGEGSSRSVQSVDITTVKLPGENMQDDIAGIQETLERVIPSWNLSFTDDQLKNNLSVTEQQTNLAKNINNTPPKVLYANQPSILVSIDGAPKLQQNADWGVETVVNSPFTIIKNKDGLYYLYGGKHWYSATAATGPYKFVAQAPANLTSIESAITAAYKNSDTEQETKDYTISNIIVSTEPAELLQTDGEAKFSAVQGTNLLYVKNTDDDIFMDVNSQTYYVLLSGRWYKSKTLSGRWEYVGADQLPADFARIPSNSDKADVLASVAGTEEARDAVQDAQVPQTAKVDRNNTNLDVIYDGDPMFESIDGTHLQYATNSPYSVIRYRNRYYAVDNGVWFESYSARGPWVVSVERPYEVVLIPPRYPVYHVKYVYIYDVYPDYVYMGYTPGYLNTFIYGPTVVFGTGYYYRPWYRHYYFPRPCTWGYNMRYSRWYGWGFGVNINVGWLNIGIGSGWWGYSRCGWWGPTAYRPNYCYRNYYGGPRYGYGGRGNNYYVRNNYIINNTNIYNNRRGISTRDVNRYDNNRRPDYARNNYNRNNNGNYRGNERYNNRNENGNRDIFRNDNNNRRGNDNGGYNNNNRNREYNRTPGNTDNRNNNGNRTDIFRGRENADRPQRQYNPQPENRQPGGGWNNRGGNVQPDRRVRQNESSDRGRVFGGGGGGGRQSQHRENAAPGGGGRSQGGNEGRGNHSGRRGG